MYRLVLGKALIECHVDCVTDATCLKDVLFINKIVSFLSKRPCL